MGNDRGFVQWLQQRIRRQREEDASFGLLDHIPGCGTAELAEFKRRVKNELGIYLPAEYLYFLSLSNGGGGFAGIYGTRTFTMNTPSGELFVTGFLEENKRLRLENQQFKDLIVYGETDLDYIVQDLATGEYRLRSKIGGEFYERLPDFKAILERATA